MIVGMVRYAIPNSFKNEKNTRSLAQLYEEPYFSDRFNIFRNVTLTSFAGQTNQDFTICVYHTNLIPDDKKALFDNLAKQYPFMRNIYTTGQMDIPDDLKEPHMLTFRIDNDDGMALDFVEKMHQVKESYKNKGVNLTITIPYMRQIAKIDNNLYQTLTRNFISNSMGLAYLGNDGRTIMSLGNHTKVAYSTPMLFVAGNGGLQVINGYNVANKFKKDYLIESELVVLNQKDMQDLLVKDGFAKMDLSCLPITDKSR